MLTLGKGLCSEMACTPRECDPYGGKESPSPLHGIYMTKEMWYPRGIWLHRDRESQMSRAYQKRFMEKSFTVSKVCTP